MGPVVLIPVAAFAGGVLLGLTPSALALAVVRLGSLRDRGWRRRAGALAGGVLAASWGVGAIALALARRGTAVGWGSQLQEPMLVVVLALASLGLSLHLWELLPRLRRRRSAGAEREPGLVRGHFLPGLFLTLLALAWTPPLITEPVGHALQGGSAPALVVFACLAAGLALPSLLLGALPARSSSDHAARAPRRRELLGFLPLLTVVWLLYTLAGHLPADRLAYVQLALLAVALFAWLGRRAESRSGVRFGYIMGVLLAASLAVRAAGP